MDHSEATNVNSNLPSHLRMLTTEEAAAILRKTPNCLRIWNMNQSGPIKAVQTARGSRLLWRLSDIEQFLDGGAQ